MKSPLEKKGKKMIPKRTLQKPSVFNKTEQYFSNFYATLLRKILIPLKSRRIERTKRFKSNLIRRGKSQRKNIRKKSWTKY